MALTMSTFAGGRVAAVVAAAVMLVLYFIWLKVAPKSGIGVPEIKG